MSGRILRLSGVISLLVWLSACAAAVVGGAAPGGYPAANNDRAAETVAGDASITSTINSRYVHDELVSAMDVRVVTYHGRVTLSGNLSSAEAVRRAVAIARSVKGVVTVVSRLTVVPR